METCPKCGDVLDPMFIICTSCGMPTKAMEQYRKEHAVHPFPIRRMRGGAWTEILPRMNSSAGGRRKGQSVLDSFKPDSGNWEPDER